MIVRLDSNPKIYVVPDTPITHYTGYTPTVLISSGATVVNNISGNTWVIYSNPTGATVSWGGIEGTITNQTDLINYISGQTSGLTSSWSGLTGLPTDNSDLVSLLSGYTLTGTTANIAQTLSNHTGNTSIHTPYSAITQAISAATSGLTSSWSGLTGLPTDNTDLVDLLSGYSLTSHTHSIYVPIDNTGTTYNSHITRTAQGVLDLTTKFNTTGVYYKLRLTQNGLSAYPYDASNLHRAGNYLDVGDGYFGYEDWDTIAHLLQIGAAGINVTSKIDYSDTIYYKSLADIESTFGNESLINRHYADLRYASSGHTHSQYALVTTVTGLTSTVSSHTGDTSIHFHMNDITGFTTTSDFNTYTGTTAPNTYFPISGYSFVASGACEIATSGNEVTIYAPSGSTGGGVSEAVFTGYTGVTAPATYAPLLASIKQVTGTSYTLLTTDSGKIIQFTNTGATTITIPSGSTFLEGFQCTLVSYGNGTSSGVKTIAAQSGATVKSKLSMLKLATIFGAATVYKTPTAATWVAFGDLSA